jgi:hypothetical protein
MPDLNDLVSYLTRRRTSFRQVNATCIIFELKFFGDDGKAYKEELEVYFKAEALHVRATNGRYPDLCPNRHINHGGWFCLGLAEDIKILSIERWVQNLKQFLEAQQKCEINGVWPCNDFKEWAHGDGAIYQKVVEQYYEQFKANRLGLTLDQLKVVELYSINRDQKLYHVYANGELILIGNQNHVLNKRYACICDQHGLKKHRSIGKCSEKCSKVVFIVAINDYLLDKAEKEFWGSFGGTTCCNTMKKCNFKEK